MILAADLGYPRGATKPQRRGPQSTIRPNFPPKKLHENEENWTKILLCRSVTGFIQISPFRYMGEAPRIRQCKCHRNQSSGGWYINNQHIDVTSLSTPDVKMIKKHLVMYCRSIFISLNPFKNASPPISRCFDVPLLFRHQSLRSCLHQLLLFYDIIKPRSSRRVLIKNGHFVVARGGN